MDAEDKELLRAIKNLKTHITEAQNILFCADLSLFNKDEIKWLTRIIYYNITKPILERDVEFANKYDLELMDKVKEELNVE